MIGATQIVRENEKYNQCDAGENNYQDCQEAGHRSRKAPSSLIMEQVYRLTARCNQGEFDWRPPNRKPRRHCGMDCLRHAALMPPNFGKLELRRHRAKAKMFRSLG